MLKMLSCKYFCLGELLRVVDCARLLLRPRAPPREIIEAIFQRLVILSIEVIIALPYEVAVSEVLNWP